MRENEKSQDHHGNFHPEILKPLSAALLLSLLIFLRILFTLSHPPAPLEASDLTIANILNGINNERSLRNITTLNTDYRLSKAAQEKSDDMQARHYFSHTDPEGNYIWPKIVAAGYNPYSMLGENLAIEFYNTESLIAAWMNSPTHRANVLNAGFKDQGMGLALGDTSQNQYHSAITNTFGALLSLKTAPLPPPAALPAAKSKTSAPAGTLSAPSPAPTPTPTPAPGSLNALNPRGREQAQNQSKALALSENQTNADNDVSSTGGESQIKTMATDSALNSGDKVLKNTRAINLALGILLILLLLADLKLFQKEKYPQLDKKLNNLSLLFLAIVMTVFLYWL